MELVVLLENSSLTMDSILSNVRDHQVHELNQNRKVYGEYHHLFPVLKKYDEKFFQYLRMPIKCFEYILSKVNDKCTVNWCNFHTQPIQAEERLVVTLRFLATGSSYRTLSFSFRMGVSTIKKIIEQTMKVLWDELYPVHMPAPTEAMFLKIADKFYSKWKFPHCIGAIDGKHVKIKCPPHSVSNYFNYKKFYSLVLQGVVDADYKFITIDVGGFGRQHDSNTFHGSTLYKCIMSNKLKIPDDVSLPESEITLPFFFVGDGAYPLMCNLMKPYPGQQLTPEKELFNWKLSRARMVVECAFGIIAKKWTILNGTIEQQPETANLIIRCICLLHNIIIDFRDNSDFIFEVNKANSTTNQEENNIEVFGLGKEVREELTKYFSNELRL